MTVQYSGTTAALLHTDNSVSENIVLERVPKPLDLLNLDRYAILIACVAIMTLFCSPDLKKVNHCS